MLTDRINKEIYIVTFLTFLLWWGNSSITPFLPILAKNLNFSSVDTAIFLGVMSAVRVIAQPVLGMSMFKLFKEIFAIRMTFLLLFISSLGYIFFYNSYVLIFCRGLEGLAFTTFAISIRVLINNNFEMGMISKINNYYSAAQNLGRFIGPAAAGLVISLLGIKAIFYVTILLYVVAIGASSKMSPIQQNHNDQKFLDSNINKKILNSKLLFILALHSLEFLGLGLWLSSWSIYAIKVLQWDVISVGLSFSVMALSSIAVVPLLNSLYQNNHKEKIIVGLLFLSIQPLCVVLFPHVAPVVWLSFILGGIGATTYFSSFHSFNSSILQKNQISIFYGLLGSATFLSQALGQFISPILWNTFSYESPIILDAIALLLCTILYILFFVFSINKTGNQYA